MAAAIGQLLDGPTMALPVGRDPHVIRQNIPLVIRGATRASNKQIPRVHEPASQVFLHPAFTTIAPTADMLENDVHGAVRVVKLLVDVPFPMKDGQTADRTQVDQLIEAATRDEPSNSVGVDVAVNRDREVLGKELRQTFGREPTTSRQGHRDLFVRIAWGRELYGLCLVKLELAIIRRIVDVHVITPI